MKTLNLVLPDWAFNKALELAKTHGVTDQAYISTLVVEHLSTSFCQPTSTEAPRPKPSAGDVSVPSGIPATFASARDTLKQVLMVCAHVYENGDVPKDDVHCNAMYRVAV